MSQPTLSSFFHKTTAHEAQQQRQFIAQQLAAAAAAAAAAATPPPPPADKRPVGRPKRPIPLATALSSEAASAEDNAERVKKRGKYTQWFDSPFLPAILKAYREQGGSARKTVAFLRSTDPSGTLYERLSHSTISSWFDNGKLLLRFQQQYDEGVAAARYGGPSSAFEKCDGGSEVEAEMKRVLLALREQGAPLNSRVIKWVMIAIIDAMCPEIHQHTSLSQQSISRWVRAQLGWTWRSSTTAASKLPHSWEEDGIKMAMRIGASMERHAVSNQGMRSCE